MSAGLPVGKDSPVTYEYGTAAVEVAAEVAGIASARGSILVKLGTSARDIAVLRAVRHGLHVPPALSPR